MRTAYSGHVTPKKTSRRMRSGRPGCRGHELVRLAVNGRGTRRGTPRSTRSELEPSAVCSLAPFPSASWPSLFLSRSVWRRNAVPVTVPVPAPLPAAATGSGERARRRRHRRPAPAPLPARFLLRLAAAPAYSCPRVYVSILRFAVSVFFHLGFEI